MVVVLPAPLRPTRPMRSPGCTRSAGPSADSSVRAPARTSRSVAVITLTLLIVDVLTVGYFVVGEDRGPLLRARGDRFFEVGGEQAHVELAQAFGLHVPLQASGVQSTPQRALGQLDSRPGERRDPLGHLVAGVDSRSSSGTVLGHQPDAFGLLGVDVAAGQHQLEGPRRADRPRQQIAQPELAGGQAVVDARRPEIRASRRRPGCRRPAPGTVPRRWPPR